MRMRGIGRWGSDKRWGAATSSSSHRGPGPCWSPLRAYWPWHYAQGHGTAPICSLPASPRPFLCPLQLCLLHHTWVPPTAIHLSCSFYVPIQSFKTFSLTVCTSVYLYNSLQNSTLHGEMLCYLGLNLLPKHRTHFLPSAISPIPIHTHCLQYTLPQTCIYMLASGKLELFTNRDMQHIYFWN